jgi:hypothetical protein
MTIVGDASLAASVLDFLEHTVACLVMYSAQVAIGIEMVVNLIERHVAETQLAVLMRTPFGELTQGVLDSLALLDRLDDDGAAEFDLSGESVSHALLLCLRVAGATIRCQA